MIISLVKGGLGNMMFQLAAGASLAKSINEDFGYSYDNWHCCTQYKIDHYPETIFSKLNKVSLNQPNLRLFRETGMLFQNIPKISNQVLDGYFQTEEYFDKDLVMNMFDCPIDSKWRDYTFIHIRRGDYVKYSNVHPLMNQDYYEEGIRILNPDKVIVLTDDKEWAKNHQLFGEFEISSSNRDIDDMSIMRSCKSGIIANSTFSWWGAWLMDTDDVIAPKTWFANGTSINIIPSRWKQI
jgi:hypothetical protein